MSVIRDTFDQGQGVLCLCPNFVPRRFGKAGMRLRLHPHDYYALGTPRGSIKERWFASVICAMNGPLAAPDEGLSYVMSHDDRPRAFTLKDAVAELGASLIGDQLMTQYGTWPMYAKFFDYATPLFHHLHLDDDAAALVGRIGKPEAYYFPPQLNNYAGEFPATYFGFDPDTPQEEVKKRLRGYLAGDNRITELSRAYRIELGTGWYTPPGVVHAPGSYLTYEPQWNSDVNSVYENITSGEVYDYSFLVENLPEDKQQDINAVFALMDWERNIDPHYKKHYFRPPVAIPETDGYREKWVAYGNPYIAAKETTIEPGAKALVKDTAAYGCIIIQGHGTFGAYDCEAAGMLRYGQMSADEYFVAESSARIGVAIHNKSKTEPMVILKHFGPNANAPQVNAK